MIEIGKTNDCLYIIRVDDGAMTMLVDELYGIDIDSNTISIYDRGNYIGTIWNRDKIEIWF